MKRREISTSLALLLLLILAACQQQTAEEPEAAPAVSETERGEVTAIDVPGYETWEEVLADAEGTTVNFHMWGGSDVINSNVNDDIGAKVLEQYGVTVNRVPLVDTADAVNKILDEAAAGVETGTIDLIWINGENFRTLAEADQLYGDWSEGIPNAQFVNWSDPSLAFDFGYPVEGRESP
ncbi:MAG: extracellular solute-binding protein, partial [Chloroflexota bacterium]